MKHIWKKLLAVVVASAFMLTLVACPEADGGKKEVEKQGPIAEGIYYMDVSTDNISTAWGGGPTSPAFSVVFLKQSHIDDLEKFML